MFLVRGVLQGGWVWLNDIPLCLHICEQVQTWLRAQRDSTDRFGIAGKQLVSPHYLTSNQILAVSADFCLLWRVLHAGKMCEHRYNDYRN